MPNPKQFLDYSGTTYLWQKITTELNKKGQVDSITANDNSVNVGGTAANPTIQLKISQVSGNSLEVKNDGVYVNVPSQIAYSMQKKSTADAGFLATYQLTANGTPIGTNINIPKDMVISSGEVKTVDTADEPYAGALVGDKYIELTLANADNDKLYIAVNDLIEYVTSGSNVNDMIVISIDNNHVVTASVTDNSITKAKLASDVQISLGKADTAIQSVTTGDSTSGNGTIKVDGQAVSVYGLDSAAFAPTTAFDAAGSADAVYNAILGLTNNEIDAAITAANSPS